MRVKKANKTDRDTVFEGVCVRIEAGYPLRAASEACGTKAPTFLLWVSEDAAKAERYARAKRIQVELLAAELVEIADQPPAITALGATDAGSVAHQRLRIDTRKWVLSKILPKVYGDKLAIGGADDLPALQSELLVTLDPSEAYKKLLGHG